MSTAEAVASAGREAPAGGSDGFYRMQGTEVAWGWVRPDRDPPRPRAPRTLRSPRAALEDALRPALRRPPCLVEFSGGRDSSLVLAVATGLAAAEGLPPPIAFTLRYPGLPEADEAHWQEAVVAALGVEDWERRDVDAEGELLGPGAVRSLRAHGLLWPPLVHTRATTHEAARGGAVLTGEGGDEIFGAGRLTPLHQLAARVAPPDRRALRAAVTAVAPGPLRRRLLAARLAPILELPWLRPPARRELLETLSAASAAEPLSWGAGVAAHAATRSVRLGIGNMVRLAAERDVLEIHPLLDPGFTGAVARAGGLWGFATRAQAMGATFGDLLPAPVLERSSKATFNRVAFGPRCRAFVDSWDGAGVDRSVVDPDRLRATWQEEQVHALSFALLQSVWLDADRRGRS